MSSFGLNHNLLLRGLCHGLRILPEDSFRVLGDDVVISNDELARQYLEVLSECDIPISWNKTHQGSRYAEFAGYMISRTAMQRPGQWRMASYNNMLEIAEDVGRPLDGEVSNLCKEIQKLYLFGKGIYDPLPQEWPSYVKMASEFALVQLERWVYFDAPVWHYKVQDAICEELSQAPLGLRWNCASGPPPDAFHYESVSISSELYSYLAKIASDKDREVALIREASQVDSLLDIVNLMWYDTHCSQSGEQSYVSNVRMVEIFARAIQQNDDRHSLYPAYQVLNTLWWTGNYTQEEYLKHSLELTEIVRSLLYLPTKASKDNQLIALGKRMGRFLKDKVYDSVSEYSSVRSGYYRSS